MANPTVEDIAQTQAKQEGKYDQFEKRFERMQIESDNTRSELTHAINRLFDKIDDVNAKMDAGFQKISDTRRWQISCFIACVIAACAIVGLGITWFN